MVWTLLLPIILSAIALFVASFVSWMVVRLHKDDWRKLEKEDEFFAKVQELKPAVGSYNFPHCTPENMKDSAMQEKLNQGPCGVMTIFPPGQSMGRNLGLTFAHYLGVSFCIGYLATLAFERGAAFGDVFRFVATAGLIAFLAGIIGHAIWFRIRIIGHLIESIVYALIMGVIFAALWPGSPAS